MKVFVSSLVTMQWFLFHFVLDILDCRIYPSVMFLTKHTKLFIIYLHFCMIYVFYIFIFVTFFIAAKSILFVFESELNQIDGALSYIKFTSAKNGDIVFCTVNQPPNLAHLCKMNRLRLKQIVMRLTTRICGSNSLSSEVKRF